MTESRGYEDEFPIGCRVVVRAPPGEGSDNVFSGKAGEVVSHGMWFTVRFDKPVSGWPNPYTGICPHNLRRAETKDKREAKD